MNRFTLLATAAALTLVAAPAAQAADLLITQPAPAFYDTPSASGAWEGAYIGLFGGYGFGSIDDSVDQDYGLEDNELGLSGWLVGATAGANFALGSGIVAGVAGDVAWSNISGEYEGFDYNVDWTGSLRGLVGVDAGVFMPYVTAGVAFANGTASDGIETDSQLHTGWTAGIGTQVAVTDNLSLDVQYRFSDYGSKIYDLSDNDDVKLTTNAVTAGLNWKF